MTATLHELLDTLAGPAPDPVDLAAIERRIRHRRRRRRAARGVGAGMAAIAVLAAATVLARPGPDPMRIDAVAPTAVASDTTAAAGDSSDGTEPVRLVVSPFTTTANRVAQPDPRLRFTVTARQPRYWRTAGLDTFTGETWLVSFPSVDAHAALPGTGDAPVGTPVLRQTIHLEALDDPWLPAAGGVIDVMGGDLPLQWDSESSSLLMGTPDPDDPTPAYLVVSAIVDPTPDKLRAAPTDSPQRYLVLPPGGLSAAVAGEADQVTADVPTRYDKARALQDHLRTLPYRAGGQAVDPAAIEALLAGEGGASPQFATAFALMARHLGIPTRIATGYTWGDPSGFDPVRRNYQVSDRQAHVWPEVWFAGIGWVPFEPTPGRGIPGAEGYTGVAAQQDSTVEPTLGG